jgi:uncharacterized protein (UPF0210 family)
VKGQSETDALAFLEALDDLSAKEKFLPNVGPAMLRDADDPRIMRLLAQALSTLPNIEGSAVLAGEDGIHWKVIGESAALVRYVTDHSPGSIGTFNFTGTAMLRPYAPFYPGPTTPARAGSSRSGSKGRAWCRRSSHAFSATSSVPRGAHQGIDRAREGRGGHRPEGGGREALDLHGGGCDARAPREVSIAAAIESYTGARFGSSGTMTAALIITTAVKAVPVKQIGYSGLMVPVMEDKMLARRWAEGRSTSIRSSPTLPSAVPASTRFQCPGTSARSSWSGSS